MSYDQPPPPPPPGYGAAPQPPYGGQPAGTSQKAIWSLVTGILSLFCCGLVLGMRPADRSACQAPLTGPARGRPGCCAAA